MVVIQRKQRLGSGKTQVSIVLDDEDVELLDRWAATENQSSTAFVTRADMLRARLREGMAVHAARLRAAEQRKQTA